MNVYISGISGTGMGPLALMAKAAGLNVSGSDLSKGAIYDELRDAGIDVFIGEQDGEFLREQMKDGVDWFVYTSALPEKHAELVLAKESGIKCTKRDDFTAFLVEKLGLKMVAVAGTHGKTTTTAMIVWAALQEKLPVAYIVGTNLGFAPAGSYHEGDKYFVYEADEYDRNFLKYHPWLAVIPFVSYDHPDIYKTPEEYKEAFKQFKKQSSNLIEYDAGKILRNGETVLSFSPEKFELPGQARKIDAALAGEAVMRIKQDRNDEREIDQVLKPEREISIINSFPGIGRRFERINDGVYTDYAHHPEEIIATIEMAKEQALIDKKKGVVVVYQPHQNTRQHEVRAGYKDAFVGVDKLYWLPTYLTRENESLAVIEPSEFIKDLSNNEAAEVAELNDDLAKALRRYSRDGYLVLLMTAGPADGWFRQQFD
ncbi:hypothetical protein IKF32_00345 [Candidatus Saccharibacteria bacterium]|nr:hypothetical protein [Candidatus Saccharibacteria bacterium]